MAPNVVQLVLASALSAEAIVNSSSLDGARAAPPADALVNGSAVDGNPIFPFVMPYIQAAAEKTGGLKPGFESKHDFARHCYAFAYSVASDLDEISSEKVLSDKGVPALCRGADEFSCKEFVRDLYGAAQAKKMQRAGYDNFNISFTLNKMNASATSYAAWCDEVYAYSLERAKHRVDAVEKAKAIFKDPEVLVANGTGNSSVRDRRAVARQLKRLLRGSANASADVSQAATVAPPLLKDSQAVEKLRSDIKTLQGMEGAEALLKQKMDKLKSLTEAATAATVAPRMLKVERNLASRTSETASSTTAATTTAATTTTTTAAASTTITAATTAATTTAAATTTTAATTTATMAATTATVAKTTATTTSTTTTTTTTTTAPTTTTTATTTTTTTTTAATTTTTKASNRVVQLNVTKAEAAWSLKVAQRSGTAATEAVNGTMASIAKHEATNTSALASTNGTNGTDADQEDCVCATRDGKKVCHCHPKKHHRRYGTH